MNTPFIPGNQLQQMITNQLFQGLKRGPGAPAFDPMPYQLNQIQNQLNQLQAQGFIQPSQTITTINSPGFMPRMPRNNFPGLS